MGYPQFSLRVYKKLTEDSWSSSYTEIPCGSVDLKEGIEATKDVFNFSLINAGGAYKSSFNLDDRVVLYIWRDKASPSASDMIIDGLITRINQKITSGGRILKISGANRTQYLLGNLIQLNSVGSSRNSSWAVQQTLAKVNNNNKAQVGDQRYIDYTTSVRTTKRDSSAFPNKTFTWSYKPAYQAIEEFSSNEYTEDGDYIFWIDTDNIFHWTYKDPVPTLTFTEGDTITQGWDIDEGSWDVFNAIIASVGRDCYGHGNHILQYNAYSMVDVGTKWKFINWDSVTADLINAEYTRSPTKFSTGSDGELKSAFPTAYPYTMGFNTLDSSYIEGTSSWVTANDTEYNLAVRRRAKKIGKEKAQAYLDKHGKVSYKIKVEINGTNAYTKGSLATFNVPSHSISDADLRILNIQHRFDTSGWSTVLECEEDPEYD